MTATDRAEMGWLLILLRSMSVTRDQNPTRSHITELAHCLQTADRARNAGADDELVLVALLHDAAKPLSLTSHGETIAAMLESRVSRRAHDLLRAHGELQTTIVHGTADPDDGTWTEEGHLLAEWDAASFDPTYPTPHLDEFLPLIDRLYSNAFKPPA